MISTDNFVCLNVNNTKLLRIIVKKNPDKNSVKALYIDVSV